MERSFKNKCGVARFVVMMLACVFGMIVFAGCGEKERNDLWPGYEGGGGKSFKIPLPKGYDWEVSQSWGEHCEMCDEKYPSDSVSYCQSSHMDDCCKFGWDFNLPGNADQGKPALATADGRVEETIYGENGGWGNTVIINHGSGICSRYSHLLNGSIAVEEGQSVCQGMKVAEIGSSGFSSGAHLHFQFEDCEAHEPLRMGFNDGNGIPTCVRGGNRYDNQGRYIALDLTNSLRENCEDDSDFSGEELPGGGWREVSCGALGGCPLITNCGREQNHQFADNSGMNGRVKKAAMYLYGECAVDGKSDGKFHSGDTITRAEALKIPLYLFGLSEYCGSDEPFADVDQDDWFFGIVACGVRYGLLDHASNFNPHAEVTFAQAAKFVVMAAAGASVIDIQNPAHGHFPSIGKDHWAYEYVETLYSYGGLLDTPGAYSSGQIMNRGEYALMVASMSPCFCENIVCGQGCGCNQEMFACTDGSSDPGVGGEHGSDSESTDNEVSGEPGGSGSDSGESGSGSSHDLSCAFGIECEVDPSHSECASPDVMFYIKCVLSNPGEDDLSINDLVMNLTAYSGECEVSDPHLRSGAGVQVVEAGETENLTGHYEISCDSFPSGQEFWISFDLKEKIAGVITWYYEVCEAVIEVSSSVLAECR